LAHSADCTVYAVSKTRELGIDVEYIRESVDIEAISREFFREEEYLELMALPRTQRVQCFFNCWTRKEAYLKAIGEGLWMPLNAFRVPVVSKPNGVQGLISNWTVMSVTALQGTVAALAVTSDKCTLTERIFHRIEELVEYLAQ